MLKLRSMSLIGETNDICPFVYEPYFIVFAVAEFLNSTNIKTAACTCAQFLSQNLTVRNHAYFAKVQKLFAFSKQFRPLLLKFLTVNDENDCRRTYSRHIRTTQCKLSCQKRHSISLSATGCAEICTAFPAFCRNRFNNAFFQQSRSKKLRITAHDLFFVAVVVPVLKIYVITENFEESFGRVYALYHGLSLFKRKSGHLIAVINSAPRIKMLIRSAHRSQARFYSVGNTSQRTKVK